MSTIYLLSDKSAAEIDHGRIRIKDDGGMGQDILLEDVDCAVLEWGDHISMPLLYALLEQDIPLFFVNEKGESVASMGGDDICNEIVRAQHVQFGDNFSCTEIAEDVVCGKIRRQQYLLEEYAEQRKSEALRETAEELSVWAKCVWGMDDMGLLRECEDMATRHYYRAFAEILDPSLWPWEGRADRQAHDPVNAVLNLGYAFLEREVRLAVLGACLQPYVGFLHTNNGRKDNLVLDLMELYRASVTDCFVLQLLDSGTLSPKDFDNDEKTGCCLKKAMYPVWRAAYEDYMAKPVLKDNEEKSPREMIRKEVQEFADRLFEE